MNILKKDKVSIFLFLVLIGGLCLLLYPSVSDYWNSFHQSRAIASYVEAVENMDGEEYEKLLQAARDYNQRLFENPGRWHPTDEELDEYYSLIDITGSGVMGYIKIDKISVQLPIYHGVDDAVLQIAIGHLPGTSLPVGGENTHAVMSGHRGLPSAKLFTNLDKLEEGDIFVINILNETFTYEVEKISIVLPDDVSELAFRPGADLCSLVTCTPYGVNTHRLIVTGHRTENISGGSINVSADALRYEPILVAPVVAVPILIVLFIIMMITTRKKK
ncbi:MAG: class C sortase [Clostridiales bacterium]|nr:class C sortase [Clostridiales bacterium]